MKKIPVIYLILATAITSVMADHIIDESVNAQFLYVISATSGTYDGEMLTLIGVPSVVYFSDRPYRIAGHVSLEEFVELWDESADSFETNPPNATLSVLEKNGKDNIVIELLNPVLTENGLSFQIEVINGEIPDSFGSSALFVDPDTVAPMITD